MPETEANKKERIEICLLIGRLVGIVGFHEGSLNILQDAIDVAEEIGDERSLVLISSRLGRYHLYRGDILEAIECSEKAFRVAESKADLDLIAPIGVDLVIPYLFYSDILKANDIALKVIYMLEKTQRESEFFGRTFNVYSELNILYGFNLALLGKFDAAKTTCNKGLSFARNLNHLPSMAEEIILGGIYVIQGDGKNAIKHIEIGKKYSEQAGLDFILPLTFTNLGEAYYYIGDLSKARSYVENGLKIQEEMRIQMGFFNDYFVLCMIDLDLGEYKHAQRLAETALNQIKKTNIKGHEGIMWALTGRILGKKDPPEFDKGEQYIHKGIQILTKKEFKPWASQGYLYLGDLYNDMGRRDEALQHLRKAEEMFQEMGMDYWLNRTKEILGKASE